MARAIHQGDERRERGNGEQRTPSRLLSTDLQAALPPHKARLCLRWRHAGPQAAHRGRETAAA